MRGRRGFQGGGVRRETSIGVIALDLPGSSEACGVVRMQASDVLVALREAHSASRKMVSTLKCDCPEMSIVSCPNDAILSLLMWWGRVMGEGR